LLAFCVLLLDACFFPRRELDTGIAGVRLTVIILSIPYLIRDAFKRITLSSHSV